MSNKKSIIAKCVYTSPWQAPNGSTIHYHELTMQNGDIGNVGKKVVNPPDIAVGVEIEYTIDGKKINIVKQNNAEQVQGNNPQYKKKSSYAAKPTDFLGYSYAYAKDLVVAGKVSEADMKDLKRIAELIYAHIGELINKDTKPEQ